MTDFVSELKKQSKTADMMITMHSILHSRYRTKSLIVDIVVMLSTAILTIFVFFDYNILKSIGINTENSKFVIEFSSLLIFFLTLVNLIVDWKGKGDKHDQACSQISKLKDQYKVILSEENLIDKNVLQNQTIVYNQVLNMLPRIPSKQFNKLKLMHKRKVKLSILTDKYPGAFLWLLKIKVYYNDNERLLHDKIE